MEHLLEIRGLKTHFATEDGMVRAVDGVDLTIDRGETLGIVGESGCGKTVTALSVLKLIAMPPGRIVAGEILWQGRNLVALRKEEMRRIRSKEIGIIFQEPMTSLNPVYTVGEQVAEAIRQHEGLGRRAALEKAVEMLRVVRIPNPERRVRDYPHQPEHFDCLLQRGTPPEPFMLPNRLGNLLADGVDGVERCHRLLEDDANFLAPDPPHLLLAQRNEIAALPEDLAGDDPPGRHRDQLEHGECRDGLATAGFADDAEGFAAVYGKIDAIDGMHHAVVRGKMRLQTAYFEQMLHITSLCGDRAHRAIHHR